MTIKNGVPVRIVQINANNRYSLNTTELEKILLREEIRDRNVVLVSVAGATRKGKSFLLDFFLRYLYANYPSLNSHGEITGDKANWLGSSNDSLAGFSWRGGMDRDTSGILLWSDVFFFDKPDGEKLAILVMDTQGIFDNQSTVNDNTVIFALSTLVASFQIFNLQNNIQEDDLQHLQLFTEFGKLALLETGMIPFQKLLFLVRDWNAQYEHDYGDTGGKPFLTKKLTVTSEQANELQSIRKNINSCFEEIDCYLMPHPGFEAAENKTFAGKLEEIRPIFIKQLLDLVPYVLKADNLLPKRINGEKVTARSLYNYFYDYVEIFNSDTIPTSESLHASTARTNNLNAVIMSTEHYSKKLHGMDNKRIERIEQLDEIHNGFKQEAINIFNSQKRIGGEEYAAQYRSQLVDHIEKLYAPVRAAAIVKIKKDGFTNTDDINILEIILRTIGDFVAAPFKAIGKIFSKFPW